jgi:hypothetical protein
MLGFENTSMPSAYGRTIFIFFFCEKDRCGQKKGRVSGVSQSSSRILIRLEEALMHMYM